jgi:rRNA maturation protein Nop10
MTSDKSQTMILICPKCGHTEERPAVRQNGGKLIDTRTLNDVCPNDGTLLELPRQR